MKRLLIIPCLLIITQVSEAQHAGTLKVMTYNIWNGFDWGKDTTRHANTVHWIADQRPDVVALQELCGYTLEQLRADAAQWGHPHVQLLKTEGYPTGLTSREPITLKEKNVEDFWHGLLHAETYEIDFYVVHLSPADVNFRMQEASQIVERVRGRDEPFIILGDFNCHSPFDGQAMERKTQLRERRQPKEDSKYSNVRLGQFDYAVMSQFLAIPALDVALGRTDLSQGFTFPAPVLVGLYDQTEETIVQSRVRIDYILASPELAGSCTGVKIFNGEETSQLSDHYPVVAEFRVGNRE